MQTPILLEGDSLSVLSTLDDGVVDCVITSPPYFGLINYEADGQYGLEDTTEEYLSTQSNVFGEVFRVMTEGAICWVVIGDTSNNLSPIRTAGERRKMRLKETSPGIKKRRRLQSGYREKESLGIPHRFLEMARELGFIHRNTLIWDKGTQSTIKGKKTDSCNRGYEFIFQLGKWTKKRSRPYFNCTGAFPSVIRGKSPRDMGHPCPLPLSLVDALLCSSSEEGGVVLDPYVGSGVTCIVATQRGRHSIGIDLKIGLAKKNIESRTGLLGREVESWLI